MFDGALSLIWWVWEWIATPIIASVLTYRAILWLLTRPKEKA